MNKHLFCVCLGVFTAVFFASRLAMAQNPVHNIPTLSEWGMLGTAVVMGLAGAYRILRRKK